MTDSFGVGLSALNSLQAAIRTTGQNIANVNTEGYSKQRVQFVTAPPNRLGSGFVGSGVQISSIERVFDEFLTRDIWARSSSATQFESLAESATRVDELFADASTGIGPAISEFFSALEAVSNSPTTLPERELAISAGETLAERFEYFDDRLSSFQDDLNIKISSSVLDINQFAESIAALNSTISLQQAGTGTAAGDLLDQRDQAITELSRLVKTTVQQQDDGALNIFIGQGQPLVIGTDVSTVGTVPDSERANRLDIVLTTRSGVTTDITQFVSEGEIGASFIAYEDVIEQARRDVGVLAAGITVTFNEVHRSGFDLNDNTDLNFFDTSAADPGLVPLATNSGVTSLSAPGVDFTATIYDPAGLRNGDITQVNGDSFRLTYTGGQIAALNLTTNETTTYAAPGSGTDFDELIGGVRVFIGASTVDNLDIGDRFLLEPTTTSAEKFGVALTEASQLAAASAAGQPGDATVVLSLIDLGDQSTLIDGATYFDIYTNTSSRIAVQTRRAQSLAETEAQLLSSAEARRSNVGGVSLEEEAANLIRFQQAYQAAAQVIATSRDVFDILVRATE